MTPSLPNIIRVQWLQAATLAGVIGITLWLFWPGLSGPFLFDDIPNLSKIAHIGGVDDIESFKAYVFSPRAPERSLTFATFLIHDNAWPTDPYPFKRFNLLLHVLNGLLIFLLARQLARMLKATESAAGWTALATAAAWSFHPLHVSTMMLTVQRLVEVSAFFTLAGLIVFIAGRKIVNNRPAMGYLLMSAGIGFGGVLGVLGKGNGILIALYALVIEYTLIRHCLKLPAPRFWRPWASVFLLGPYLLFGLYVAMTWEQSAQIYEERRAYDVAERLLTQARVLFEYLYRILIPQIGGSGIYHDDYRHSTGLLSPLSTLPAVLGVIVAGIFGILARSKWPVISFGILWFLAGHMLESTFLHLELYFEHRNYLPMFGPLFACVILVARGFANFRLRTSIRYGVLAGFFLFLSLEMALARNHAQVWGNVAMFSNVAAAEKPESARTQQTAARFWLQAGAPSRALRHIQLAIHHNPDTLSLRLQHVYINCRMGRDTTEGIETAMEMAPGAPFDFGVLSMLPILKKQAAKDLCPGLTLEAVDEVIARLLSNPTYRVYPRHHAHLWVTRANVAALRREFSPTMHALDRAYEADPRPRFRLLQVAHLLTAGRPDLALEKLNSLERDLASTSLRKRIFSPDHQAEIDRYRQLAKELQESESTESTAGE